MPEKIDKIKLTINRFTCELSEPLDPAKRLYFKSEADVYETAYQDCQENNFYNQVFKAKIVGATQIKQGGDKIILGKSKRSPSQRLRIAISTIDSSEEYYQKIMNKIILNIEEVAGFLENI